MKTRLLRLFPLIALICALASTGVYIVATEAAASIPWYHGTVTQHYGKNAEHGVDIETNYKAVTALLPGRVTGVYVEKWESPRPMVITWQLTRPVCYRGHCADYMYVQIATSKVWKGEYIKAGQMLGWSYSFIEVGFTNVPAYGHAGYVWQYSGIDPLRIWPWL
jgi:hypothetical protein